MKPSLCLIAAFAVLWLCTPAVAQMQDTITSSKTTKVYLEHANSLSYDRNLHPDIQVLVGDVVFRHDSSFMYCDSAWFYESSNSLEAFSRVRMEQGDTLFIYGDWLHYDGNTQLARLRRNVRMVNNQVTLYTDSLNYNRSDNKGYYFGWGRIVDEGNTLSSRYGQYAIGSKEAVFNDSVVLVNPEYTLRSDTLHYNTDSKIATILGPSVIQSDSGKIYSSRGWYNTATNVSLLLDRSRVVSGNRMLTGDSISRNKVSALTEVFGNMILQDTARKVILEGQYGYYDERTEFAFVTARACLKEYSQGDTLYIHADTLQMFTVDSACREIKAYYGVRFFRTDWQGVCDSMLFNTRDSILYMYSEPVIWSEAYQLYGDTILIYMNDSTIDHAHVLQFAFAIEQLDVDTSCFNQLKGNDMVAHFEGKALRRLDVSGNAETIFFPLDNNEMIGMNQTQSAYLTLWVRDNKLDRLKLWPQSEGVLTPISDLQPTQKTLKDFYWFDYLRPTNKDDIYRHVRRKPGQTPGRNSKFLPS